MNAPANDGYTAWPRAVHAAALFAIDPLGTAGVSLRARPGPVRDAWLALLRELLPPSTSVRRVPHNVGDNRLLGGLDLAATLQAGRPVAEQGLLAQADRGVMVLTMAERAAASVAARLGAALDSREAVIERDGITEHHPARFGLVLLDEGIDEESPPPALLDRLAFHIDVDAVRWSEALGQKIDRHDIAQAQMLLPETAVGEDVLRAICEAALALGIWSIRPSLLALRAARAAAALAGRRSVSRDDAALAAALVLAPRATLIPDGEPSQAEDERTEAVPPDDRQDPNSENEPDDPIDNRKLADVVIQAAQAAMPPGLLAQLQLAGTRLNRTHVSGRSGAVQASLRRGRPAGVRRGEPRAGARLNVIETLRAAAPWQMLRRRDARPSRPAKQRPTRVDVRRDDFRVTRLEQRTETTSIFAVDASGSSAFHRLAEAKGAVEQLLSECYIRRDRVAVLAFRGSAAELILPPTRSLARAKRCLAGMPGGGGTPLATAIDAACALADATRRKGQTPVVILLTDGRGNIARNGQPGREQAERDARASAGALRAAGLSALVVDISPQSHDAAKRLAADMGAQYLPLPYADGKTLSRAVQAASAGNDRSHRMLSPRTETQ